MTRHGLTAEARFWAKVEKTDECWLWTASVGTHGYGQFYPKPGQLVLAHRFSFVLANGEVPAGMFVLHHCDVRRCVRPSHLFAGTNADNMRDAHSKGRLVLSPATRRRRYCRHGHEMTEANSYWSGNPPRRYCRACMALRGRPLLTSRRKKVA